MGDRRKAQPLVDNFYEFETDLLKLAQGLVIWKSRKFVDSMRQRLQLDRRVSCLVSLHQKIAEILAPLVVNGIATYKAALAEFGTHDGKQVARVAVEERDDVGNIVRSIPVASELVEALESMRARNEVFPDFSRRFASNRVDPG